MNVLAKNNAIVPRGAPRLPDKAPWCNRFEIRSETSDNVYVVAQNMSTGKWACSCKGWISNRHCKHLKEGLGLTDSQIHGREQKIAQKRNIT
jgi:hypothetical protein